MKAGNGDSRCLRGLVLVQLRHSLHQVLHNQVHVCSGGISPHAQPQGILCHVVGDPTAEQNGGGPETDTGVSGFNSKAKEAHASPDSYTMP